LSYYFIRVYKIKFKQLGYIYLFIEN